MNELKVVDFRVLSLYFLPTFLVRPLTLGCFLGESSTSRSVFLSVVYSVFQLDKMLYTQ